MDSLPTEIVELVLASESLQIEDIINTSLTCKYLRDVVNNSNYIWRSLFFKRWPNYKDTTTNPNEVNFIEEIKNVYDVRRKVRGILETMSPKYYTTPNMSRKDFSEWSELVDGNSKTYVYVIDYLSSLMNDNSPIKSIEAVPLLTSGNRTLRYYCLKTIQYLKQMQVTTDFKEFISLPERKQILERAAVIVAQWCQPELNITYSNICKQLNNLASQATDELKMINPNHPLFKVAPEMLDQWRDENLEENQFNAKNNMQIVDALQITLFKKNKFFGNITDYYMYQNSFLNIVLDKKYGLPITLSIVYESVARRLGVNCEPMNIPAHFLLRFRPDPLSNSVLFIDAFNDGQLFPKGICPHSHSSPDRIPRATAYQVLKRMAANLEESLRVNSNYSNDLTYLRSISELLVFISPKDLNYVLNLSRLCMSLNMDTHYIKDIITTTEYDDPHSAENILQMLRDYEIHRQNEHFYEQHQPKKRTTVKFAVGMVMRHRILNYTGVITDWTPVCEASQTWQKTMNVDKLKFKHNQPFYYVIVQDGTQRCVAEENIEVTGEIAQPYFNEQIGRHFSHYFVNHYVPNAEKEREYPEDTVIRHNYYQAKMWTA